MGGRCRASVNDDRIDLSAFEYLSRPQMDGCFSFFSLLYVEASNLSVYCIVEECTVHANRVLYSSLVMYRMIVISLSFSDLFVLVLRV